MTGGDHNHEPHTEKIAKILRRSHMNNAESERYFQVNSNSAHAEMAHGLDTLSGFKCESYE